MLLRSAQFGGVLDEGNLSQMDGKVHSPPCRSPESRGFVRVPFAFAAKTPEQIRSELWGFSPRCVEAALRFHASGAVDELIAIFPGLIEFHLPSGTAKPPAVLRDEFRLNQDLGIDSLALTEIAFKLDELFGVPIEIREMGGVQTVADFKALLIRKFAEA